MQFTLPPGEQEILVQSGLNYQARMVKLSEVDWEASRDNQARLDSPLVSDLVETYTSALKGGAKFPAMIFARNGKSKGLVIWSGNNRGAAYKSLGYKEVPGVVVECDDEVESDLLPRQFNITGGRGLTTAERSSHAMMAMDFHGLSAAEAAKRFMVSREALSSAIRCKNVRDRLESLRIKPGHMKNAHFQALSKVADNDSVLEALGRVAVTKKLTASQLDELVNSTRKGKTESSRLEIVRNESKLLDSPGAAAREVEREPRNRKAIYFKQLIVKLENQLHDITSLTQIGITGREDIALIAARMLGLATKLKRVAEGKA